jgi:hypothetical protein
VEAFLAERGEEMGLKAADLIQLADAGVPDNVIDVAVATSYPRSFQLASGMGGGAGNPSALDEGSLRRSWGMSVGYAFNPWAGFGYGAFDYGYYPYGYGYNRYGYGYGYGYGPGYYGPGYGGYRPVVVVVDRETRPHGRVIAGRGYSQGRGSSSGPSSKGYVPRSTGGASGSPAASGSGARSSGSSSGSSTGRTAKPRGGGGS